MYSILPRLAVKNQHVPDKNRLRNRKTKKEKSISCMKRTSKEINQNCSKIRFKKKR